MLPRRGQRSTQKKYTVFLGQKSRRMEENALNRCFFFISGHGRGWAFSSKDLMGRWSRQQADTMLSELARIGKIRRLTRGLYDYPEYSPFLKSELAPNMEQVAGAFARKFNWRIVASGETALNLIGLSTQIPARYVFFSDAPARSYDILGTRLEFRKTTLKDIGFKHKESALIVQALKALGKEQITGEVIEQIRNWIKPSHRPRILRDAKGTTDWIYEAMKSICGESGGQDCTA